MAAPNFVLITELQTLSRRDFPLADPTILMPSNANPLLDGEFLELDSASYQLKRTVAAGPNALGATNEGLSPLLFPVHTEKGRSDTQAIGKTNVLMLGQYEAETTLCLNVAGLAIGDALTVQDVSVGGVLKRGLGKKVGGAASGVVIVGYVSRLPGNGKARFVHFSNQKVY